jgi:broad specificity phosphatase PhoE
VVRHADRADAISATIEGKSWMHTADSKQWPKDPPLSDEGVKTAQAIGQSLHSLAAACSHSSVVVACSPYLRCVQTAIGICERLPGARLLFDLSLGEIYGPSVMGTGEEPAAVTRSIEQLLAYCRARGVTCSPQAIGRWPVWPEDVDKARVRLASRFLVYLKRSADVQRNFILVTHADGVAAALRVMPSHYDQVAQRVEYGGRFMASRSYAGDLSQSLGSTSTQDALAPFREIDEAGPSSVSSASSDQEEPVLMRTASDGWQVETHDMWLAPSAEQRLSHGEYLRGLMQYSRLPNSGRVNELLRELCATATTTLSEGASEDVWGLPPNGGEYDSLSPLSRQSTFVFGNSDVGSLSDLGRPEELTELVDFSMVGSPGACSFGLGDTLRNTATTTTPMSVAAGTPASASGSPLNLSTGSILMRRRGNGALVSADVGQPLMMMTPASQQVIPASMSDITPAAEEPALELGASRLLNKRRVRVESTST